MDRLIEYRYNNKDDLDFTKFNKLVLESVKEVAPN